MKITWVTTDDEEVETSTVLADHADDKHASGFAVAGQSQAQVADRLRQTTSEVFDRGNLVNRISFNVTMLEDDIAEAALATLRRSSELGRAGTLEFEFGIGGFFTEATAEGAVLQSVNAIYKGATWFVSYDFLCGAIEEI